MKLSTKQKQKIARQAYKEICESLNIPYNMILESIDSEILKENENFKLNSSGCVCFSNEPNKEVFFKDLKDGNRIICIRLNDKKLVICPAYNKIRTAIRMDKSYIGKMPCIVITSSDYWRTGYACINSFDINADDKKETVTNIYEVDKDFNFLKYLKAFDSCFNLKTKDVYKKNIKLDFKEAEYVMNKCNELCKKYPHSTLYDYDETPNKNGHELSREQFSEYVQTVNDKIHELGHFGDELITEFLQLEKAVLREKSLISIVGEIIHSINRVVRDYDGTKRADVLRAMLDASWQK